MIKKYDQRVTYEQRQQLWERYRYLQQHPEEMTHRSIVTQLSKETGRQKNTIRSNLFKIKQHGINVLIDEHNAKLTGIFGADFTGLIRTAQGNFKDALEGKKELSSSQWAATKTVLERVERALMPKKAPAKGEDKPAEELPDWVTQ